MRQPELDAVEHAVAANISLPLRASSGTANGYMFVDLHPADLDVGEGFAVRVALGWKSVSSTLVFESYARHLVGQMGDAPREHQLAFARMASAIANRGASIKLEVNEAGVDPFNPEGWPSDWTSCELSIERLGLEVDHGSGEPVRQLVVEWASTMFGLALTLLPVAVDDIHVEPGVEGLPEGSRIQVVCNRYERSARNRQFCIQAKGAACLVCGLDFGEAYGVLGVGFIHVHHVVPVSEVGPGYVIDPLRDLVPLCPNCHAMAHRESPPITVDELRSVVSGARRALSTNDST